ncbi:relaxase/mobilization nuclease domain-containing protein [Gluconacetobacter entanii]|uniref:Type VI secretion protein n=1 Tax=Gluconacetobacter entanii TaxID=108528 RepID=A0A318PUU0_9PROT|nr:VirD2 family relaxase/mobilization nuclease [Gluconacetobacter entanii]PYD63794.1 type VI secretion protein [Gluconacetobacter entanii]
MARENDFQPRLGRIRSPRAQRLKPFVAQALASAQRAGGGGFRSGRSGGGSRSSFGRGRVAAARANRLLTSRARRVTVKARVVRHSGRKAPLAAHLRYLRREWVTKDGEKARLFGPGIDDADPKAFAERCEDDRHHFRFIVSPEDAPDMADLKGYARELVGQMEKDLGTKLDWVGVDHWNTQHPHVHILVRGVAEDGSDLVISRDYIREGLRARAQDLVTQELGPRNDVEIHRALERQVDAEHWTQLDRQLARDAGRNGIIDMAPAPDRQPDPFEALKVGRLRSLEGLGLAHQVGQGQWMLDESAEVTLRELGERGDIIKRIHRSLTERGIERSASSYVLGGESLDVPVIGRLVDRGLDDELKGTAYAVIDGVDGRTHHIRFPDLDATGDGSMGSVVELRAFDDRKGQRRVALAVRSDLSIEDQVTARGATWLDRQAVARDPAALGQSGFGAEVREAMERRTEQLIEQGLAERRTQGVVLARNLIGKLRDREVREVGEQLAGETGRAFSQSASGEYVTGTYRQRMTLASGRYAMIDDGLQFQLVPWTPSLEKQRGQHVYGVARDDGGIDWSFTRNRGLGL